MHRQRGTVALIEGLVGLSSGQCITVSFLFLSQACLLAEDSGSFQGALSGDCILKTVGCDGDVAWLGWVHCPGDACSIPWYSNGCFVAELVFGADSLSLTLYSPCEQSQIIIIIIMYIFCALINTLSSHIIHNINNLNMILYTHVEHSPIKDNLHKVLYGNKHTHTHTHTDYD